MKKFIILSAVVFTSLVYQAADAQVRINVNIGNQPDWGPYGYNRATYYYLPDIDVYYNVPNRTYTYYEGRNWVTRTYLPARYRNYDLYRGYKVVVNDRDPWSRAGEYRNRYVVFKNRHDQQNIRDYRNSSYAREDRHDDRWGNKREDRHDDRHDGPGRGPEHARPRRGS